MTKDEALKLSLEAITQYLAECPDPSEEAVEGLCDAASVAREALAQPEQEQIAAWLEKECDEQYLADRVRAGDYAKEKGHTENCAALADDIGKRHLPPSPVGIGESNSTAQPEQEPVFCEYCGGNDENPPDHCMDCARPQPKEQEPFGHVTVCRLSQRFENHYDQYHFYPAGQSPYLDNVDECHTVYTTPPQRTDQNFCQRCGKRTKDLTHIHTCTPPQEKST